MQPVTGKLKSVLRLEGMAIFIVSILTFSQLNTSWLVFSVLFLTPDIALIGYLFSKRNGATTYNLTHSLIGPALLISAAFTSENQYAMAISCIWVAHIGFDRALGYGLKYSSGFRSTHLGIVGKENI